MQNTFSKGVRVGVHRKRDRKREKERDRNEKLSRSVESRVSVKVFAKSKSAQKGVWSWGGGGEGCKLNILIITADGEGGVGRSSCDDGEGVPIIGLLTAACRAANFPCRRRWRGLFCAKERSDVPPTLSHGSHYRNGKQYLYVIWQSGRAIGNPNAIACSHTQTTLTAHRTVRTVCVPSFCDSLPFPPPVMIPPYLVGRVFSRESRFEGLGFGPALLEPFGGWVLCGWNGVGTGEARPDGQNGKER